MVTKAKKVIIPECKSELKNYDALMRRLNIIIGLLFDLRNEDKKGVEREEMHKLKQLGLENIDIGLIFGKSKDQVTQQLYNVKRKKGKKK